MLLNQIKAFTQLGTSAPIFQFAKKQIQFDKWNIVKGDKVVIISGKDSGKTGTVWRVYRASNQVLINGINQKFKRKTQLDDPQGNGIQQVTRPLHISKVSLIDPEKGVPTRISRGYLEDGSPVRISKLTGSIINKNIDPAKSPAHRHKNKIDGLKDTSPAQTLTITYKGEDFNAIRQEFETRIKEKEQREELLWFVK